MTQTELEEKLKALEKAFKKYREDIQKSLSRHKRDILDLQKRVRKLER